MEGLTGLMEGLVLGFVTGLVTGFVSGLVIGFVSGLVTGFVIGCTGLVTGRSIAGLVGFGVGKTPGWLGKRLPLGFLLSNKAIPSFLVAGRE